MAPLSPSEREDIIHQVKEALSKTLYACTTLEQLSGGTSSFVYRGDLAKRITSEDGHTSESVIVKHATDFASCNRDFPLDSSRCFFEVLMLDTIRHESFNFSSAGQFSIDTPRLYYSQSEPWVEVIEYLPDTITLKESLKSYTSTQAKSIGYAVGSWLRYFHEWTAAGHQKALRQKLTGNRASRGLKWKITYQQGSEVLNRFSDVLDEEGKRVWGDIKRLVGEELQKHKELEDAPETDEKALTEQDNEWGIVHGDFWSGNVLSRTTSQPQLSIIDFEFAQINHRSIDLGSFIGDLLERQHFDASTPATDVVSGFLKGYGPLSTDMAFRTALHAAVHMINWWGRGPKTDEEKNKQGVVLVDKAWNMIRKAWDEHQKGHMVALEELFGLV